MSASARRLGGCRMERVQSRSEHSLLYRAHSEELDREVMIKVLDPRYPPDSRTARRFLRGGEIARSLEHDNIVRTFAAGREGRTLYMLMEFLPGHSLDRVLQARKKLQYPVACDIVRQVAQALEYASAAGVVHRKLEPAHVMLSPGGRVCMLGFGLARLADPQDAGITAEGALVGVSPYSAPETGEGTPDVRADLYSLGAVMYHMLGGRPPFEGRDPLELLRKHRKDPPWPVRDLAGPELPEEVEQIVHSLMAKEIERRIQSPAELIACIDAATKPELVGSSRGQAAAGQTLIVSTREMMALRKRQTVLVCDDQSYNIHFLHEVLRRLGFSTLTTRDGGTAAEALREKSVDLFITDVRVPGLAGRGLLEAAVAARPQMPVILTRGGDEAVRLGRDAGLNIAARLERPLDAHALRETVQKVLS